MKNLTQTLTWNRPQMQFMSVLHTLRQSCLIWGRGTGKSAVIAWLIHMILQLMPRSTWSIQGATYQQLLTRTLPGTFEWLEKLGYQRDIDYWINKRPIGVRSEQMPYYAPLKFDNYITIKRRDGLCVGFMLLSQDSNSRGTNTDGVICDESLLLNMDRFAEEVTPTNRGHEIYFKKIPLHHGIFHFSSMPVGDSRLFDMGSYYGDALNDLITSQKQMISLQLDFIEAKENEIRREIYREIHYLQSGIHWYAKNRQFYSEYNVFENLTNLGLRYLLDMYKTTPLDLFKIEALNERHTKVTGGFYAAFDRSIHCYTRWNVSYLENLDFDFDKAKDLDSRADADCDTNAPLYIGTDYGNQYNWIIVGQKDDRLCNFRVIKEVYTMSPKILDDTVQEFCQYYRHHKNKLLYFNPDAEGYHERANSQSTYVDTSMKILRDNGWSVKMGHRMKYNKYHDDTYYLVNGMLSKEQRKDLYSISINSDNCKNLILAMEKTPTKEHKGLVKKDKSSERIKEGRITATDSTDALDQMLYYTFKDMLKGSQLRFSTIFFK